MNERQRLILGVAVIGFVILVLASFMGNLTPYKTVSEVVAAGEIENVQVNGTIVPGSTVYYSENHTRIFELTDGKAKMKVVFSGALSNYQEGIPAVVRGSYKDGVFYAEEVLLKCPSKYQTIEEEEK